MKIHIESLKIDTIIGLLDFERIEKQQIILDLEAVYSYDGKSFVNYADLVTVIEQEIKQCKYELLEEALLDLKEKITQKYPQITQLSLKIAKPDILSNCSVALSEYWDIKK